MHLKKLISLSLALCLFTTSFSLLSTSAAGVYKWPATRFEAEGSQLSHGTGRSDGDGWICEVGVHNSTHMIYGPYVNNLPAGRSRAVFNLKVDNRNGNNDKVVSIDVNDVTSGKLLNQIDITRNQFSSSNAYQNFVLDYTQEAGHTIEFRVWWYGNVTTKVNYIDFEKHNYIYEAESLSHGTGRLDGDGWLCQTNIDAGNKHMVYGPYVNNIPEGNNRAFYKMKVDNNSANDNNIATIDVRDSTTGSELASRTITRKQFKNAGVYQTFYLPYTQVDGHSIEFRVYWHGTSYLKVDHVGVESVPYSTNNWMGSIGDNRNLASLSIPGTHDSGALYEPVAGTAKCQDQSIANQLNMGVRFLDIRCRHIDNLFTIHHGSVYQNQNFQDVLNTCISFLNNNPTETILMSVKEEYDASNTSRSFAETFDTYVNQNPSKWYTGNTIPNLKDVRGKIVLVRRFGGTNKGIDCTAWGDNTTFNINNASNLKVQDQYVVPDNGPKWDSVQNMNNEAASTNSSWLYLNFSSGYKSIIGIPSITTVSNHMNPQILKYFTANAKGRFGVSIMDFVNQERSNIIISTNF